MIADEAQARPSKKILSFSPNLCSLINKVRRSCVFLYNINVIIQKGGNVKIKKVYFPNTVREAVSLLGKKNSIYIAGSTYSFKNIPENTEIVVCGRDLPICGIKKDQKHLIIGAGATFDQIEKNKLCSSLFDGLLSKAASACSSQLIRNMATVGGNLSHLNAFNLFPVLSSCLNAQVKIYGKGFYKKIFWKDLYSGKYKPGINCLITELIFPLSLSSHKFYFRKVSKIKSSWDSYITVCFRADVSRRKIKDLKLSIGAVRALPYSDEAMERDVIAKELNSELIKNISSRLESGILSLHANSKINSYRASLAKNLSTDFLSGLMED